MKCILGYKKGMTQIFTKDGKVVPVTLIEAGPCVVTAVKTKEKDGYDAAQIGFGESKKVNRALKGHLQKTGKTERPLRHLAEFLLNDEKFTTGQVIDVTTFGAGDKVKVTGITKGRGFQGVVRRHGFAGGKKTHGHKDQLRMPGSIGAGGVQKVLKGRKMAGQMGNTQQTVSNLAVVDLDKEKNLLVIKGAVPGMNGGLVKIFSQ